MSADRETYLSAQLPGATLSVFNMHGSQDVLITLETSGDAKASISVYASAVDLDKLHTFLLGAAQAIDIHRPRAA